MCAAGASPSRRVQRQATRPTTAAPVTPTTYGSAHARRLNPSSIGAARIVLAAMVGDERRLDLVARHPLREILVELVALLFQPVAAGPIGQLFIGAWQPPQLHMMSPSSCLRSSLRGTTVCAPASPGEQQQQHQRRRRRALRHARAGERERPLRQQRDAGAERAATPKPSQIQFTSGLIVTA